MSSSEPSSPFGESLRNSRAELRRGDLRRELSTQADTLREFILLADVHEQLAPDSDTLSLDDDTKDQIRTIRRHVDDGEIGQLESDLDAMGNSISDARNQAQTAVEEHRLSVSNTLQAMARLNERVENVDPERISTLQDRYEALTDLSFVDGDTIADQRASVERTLSDMQTELEEIQKDVFGKFYGSDLESVVRRLLDDETFRIDDLTADQFKRLKESELADCLELLLS